ERHSRERDSAEHELRAMAEMLEATLSAAPLGIFTLSADGVITQWNPSAELPWGYSTAEMIGKRSDDVMPPAEALRPPAEILATLRRGEPIRDVHTRRRRRTGDI